MAVYYFPLGMLFPPEVDVEHKGFKLVRRRWDTTQFDLATLAVNHKLRMSSELMYVMLQGCNCELRIEERTLEHASDKAMLLREMLYVNGAAATVIPFASTHSVNDYSGINSRDNDSLREKLPEGMRVGITSNTAKVEVWPAEPTLLLMPIGSRNVEREMFVQAVEDAEVWQRMSANHAVLQNIQDVLRAAPFVPVIGQALLHVWTGLESIFPEIRQEVTFRLALMLTQMNAEAGMKPEYYKRVKASYGARSDVAHGSKKRVTQEQWQDAWQLLIDSCKAIIRRGKVPTEDELQAELLYS